MSNDVENSLSDFSRNRWARTWQSAFFTIYSMVMVVSLFLYLCLLRAVAKNSKTKETPLNLFILFFFFTSLVEDAIVIEQFVMINHTMSLTTFVCQLFTYTVYGNKILQALGVIALLYYMWLYLDLKNVRVEKWTKRSFPLIVVGLLVIELFLTIWPMINVRASMSGQQCYNIDGSFPTERRTGWFYLVLFPYFIPMIICAFPCLRLSLTLKQNKLAKVQSTNVKIALVVGLSFFFFHLLYFMLMLGRELEALILDRPEWRKILGLHVWFITRPMFSLICHGWHVVVPLTPFAFDEDFFEIFPGNWINKNRLLARDEEAKNSISMSDTSTISNEEVRAENNNAVVLRESEEKSLGHMSFVNPLHKREEDPDRIEAQEYNQSVV